ncbi:MAG: flavin reductase family protein [Candidatus Bathyarchaeota archaeon]
MVGKVEVTVIDCLQETYRKLNEVGLLLTSAGRDGRLNIMSIRWGFVGKMFGKPVFEVAVRPSRHTHMLIEDTGEFTVNVPNGGMADIVKYCGSVSGRDYDKFKEKKLTPLKGRRIQVPIISECSVHYECKVIYKTRIDPNGLPSEILSNQYHSGDYHTVFSGEILTVLADK